MTSPDIVVAGEALVDLAATSEANEYRSYPGGGPANAAVAFARLGARPTFLVRLSTDRFGEELEHWLTVNGVDLSLAVRTDTPTTLAVAALEDDGGASYTFYSEGTSNWYWTPNELPTRLPGAQALHFGSLASRIGPGAPLLDDLRLRCAPDLTVFIDPNFRPQLDDPAIARARLSSWVGGSDILKVSVDDVVFAYPGEDPVSSARQWSELDDILVLLTDGPRGAHAFFQGEQLHASGPPVEVIDTIGAGDAFGAAFLYALKTHDVLAKGSKRSPELVESALKVACACAAMTCGKAGADTPWFHELPADVVGLLGPRTNTEPSPLGLSS